MLPSAFEDLKPDSELSRWLHRLVDTWDGDVDYKFTFSAEGLPLRNYTVLRSLRAQNKVMRMLRVAGGKYKRREPVDLDKVEEDLAEAVVLMKTLPHFNRLRVNEARSFIKFFIELLDSVDIFGMELTECGAQALDILRCASEHGYRKGDLLEVDEVLEFLDELVEGRLMGRLGDVTDAEKDVEAGASAWINFYPEIIPLGVTLHLDAYVRPARSKEERAKNKNLYIGTGAGLSR